jgi:hypothetical protein
MRPLQLCVKFFLGGKMKIKKLHSSLVLLSRIGLGLALIIPLVIFAVQSAPVYAVAD